MSERRWRPSNVEVPDRVVDAMDRRMLGLYCDSHDAKRKEALRLGLQAGLQEWAGDRPAWSMNTPAEKHVMWLEGRVKELESAHYEASELVAKLKDLL